MEEKKVFQDDDIKEYLARLEFKKKTFGGFDREDVMNKLMELTTMYQDHLKRLEEQLSVQPIPAAPEPEPAKAPEEVKEEHPELQGENEELQKKNEELQNKNEELQSKVEILLEEQKAQEEKARLIVDMEIRQKLERNEILLRAEHEARLIKERAEQDASAMRANGRRKFVQEIKEKRTLLDDINSQINNQVCDMRSVLKITSEEFTRMQSTITGLEERLNAYPPAMFLAEEDESEICYVEQKE